MSELATPPRRRSSDDPGPLAQDPITGLLDEATVQAILRRVAQLMRPDGWLFLGAAETTLGVDDNWERVVLGRGSAYRPGKGN